MNRESDPLRWGVMGFGQFSDGAMAPAISQTKGHVIAAIQGRNAARTKAYADKYQVGFCTTSPEELLERDLDALYVATPNSLHAGYTTMAAERKIHILCEKPMATTVAEASAMVEVCKRNGVRLAIGNMMRFNPCHTWALEFIRAGKLGQITAARGRFGFDLASTYPLSTSPWHLKPEMAGGGSLLSVGVHVVDLLRYLLGKEVTMVSAMMETRDFPLPMDWATATILKFEGGAIAEVRSSFDNRFEPNDLEIFGTRGVMKFSGTLWRESNGVVEVRGDFGQHRFEPAEGVPNPYVLQIEQFAQSIRTGTEALVSGVEGMNDLKVCHAAYESARTGHTIHL
jgi:predicted dehydrogenase